MKGLKKFFAALVAAFAVFSISFEPAFAGTIKLTPANSGSFVKTKKSLSGKKLFCNFTKASPKLGFIQVVKVRATRRKKATQYKRWVSLTKSEAALAKKKKLNKVCSSVQRPPPPCQLVARGIVNQAIESQPLALTGFNAGVCGSPVALIITQQPVNGILSADGLVYTPNPHYRGTDTFRFKLTSNGKTSANEAQATINIVTGAAEFAGAATELRPYRNELTPAEVRHLLDKVLGGSPELYEIGVTQGRAALVEALLNYVTPNSVTTAAFQRGQEVSEYQSSVSPCNTMYDWHVRSVNSDFIYHLVHGNPLLNSAVVHMDDWFAINLETVQGRFGCATVWTVRDHYEVIKHYALENFEDMLVSMVNDEALKWWLDQVYNSYSSSTSGNQNFPRELMELFTTGVRDRYTGMPNYSEADVEEATRAMSGFQVGWHQYDSFISGFGGWYNAQGMRVDYDSAYAYQPSISIFPSIPSASVTGRFHPDDFALHLLRKHPAASRNFAYSWFGRYVYANPPEQVTNALASQLLATRYDMKTFFRTILNSSAMFAPQAKDDCIDSPTEWLVRFVRKMNLPMSSRGGIDTMYSALDRMGHQPFQATGVFDWKLCGDDSNAARGEVWLQAQPLLERQRAIYQILDQQTRSVSNGGEGATLRSALFAQWNNPNASQVVDRFQEIFGVTLNAAERDEVLNYLDRAGSRWNPANAALVEPRLAGVAYVFGTFVESMLK